MKIFNNKLGIIKYSNQFIINIYKFYLKFKKMFILHQRIKNFNYE